MSSAEFLPSYPLSDLAPADYNPRKLDEDKFLLLQESLRKFGVIKPVIINSGNGILTAGHQRTRAMKAIGITHCPAIRLQGISRTDEIRFNLYHNSIETNKSEVTLSLEDSELEPETYAFIAPEHIHFERNANALVVNNMSGLILRYGGWGSVVCSEDGRVLLNSDYAVACQQLRTPVLAYMIPREDEEEMMRYLSVDYGVYCYDVLGVKSYNQLHCQMHRLQGKKSRKITSTLYENHVIPTLRKDERTVDFGAGRCAYANMLAEQGYKILPYEPHFQTKGTLNVRENSLVTQRRYTYDALARPETRDTRYPNKGISHNDSFAYNHRSELTGALLDNSAYTYAYDNIGNREIAQEAAEGITYAANELNQYTRISTDGENFTPEYDADGNQTLVQTSTGFWHVTYNAQNRAVKFESADGSTIITCAYDYAGRRFEKKVTTKGGITTHHRYLYRGYLQIAAVNLKEDAPTPDLWFLIWDPTQTVATRPLAIRKDGTWYTYGWDLTKNVCELYGQQGYIRTIYRYSPYGTVTAEGDVTQPIQWSSEFNDSDLGLVYYNYRYYNPTDGRWTRRDPIGEAVGGKNNYLFVDNYPCIAIDIIGLAPQVPLVIPKCKKNCNKLQG